MSRQADDIRDRRRAFAAPGGSLDRVVRLIAVVLPALAGAIAAAMLIAPLGPRGEVSFLLDRNKVDTARDRFRVDRALYRGTDNKGRPFTLAAGEAVQQSVSVPIVRLSDLTARMELGDGPALLSAAGGSYDIDRRRVIVDGTVTFTAADGYRIAARGVSIDLPARRLVGADGVEGEIPAGTFSADRISADLDTRTLTLSGHARLRMVPGKLRMP